MKKILFPLLILPMMLFASCDKENPQYTENYLPISNENLESNGGEFSEKYNNKDDGTTYLAFKNGELKVILWKTYQFNQGEYKYSISNNTITLIEKKNGEQYSLNVSLKEQGEEEKEIFLIVNGGNLPNCIKQKSYLKNKYPLLE